MTMDSAIISRFGNRIVRWDAPSLERILNRLQNERHSYRERYQSDTGEASQGLIVQAEDIKDNANHILEAADTTQ